MSNLSLVRMSAISYFIKIDGYQELKSRVLTRQHAFYIVKGTTRDRSWFNRHQAHDILLIDT